MRFAERIDRAIATGPGRRGERSPQAPAARMAAGRGPGRLDRPPAAGGRARPARGYGDPHRL
jgi:hypothetical protein